MKLLNQKLFNFKSFLVCQNPIITSSYMIRKKKNYLRKFIKKEYKRFMASLKRDRPKQITLRYLNKKGQTNGQKEKIS